MDRLTQCFDAARERLGLKVYVPPSRQDDRNVYANNPEANRSFVDNVVITYKYTWYSFLPVFLLEQFARFANFYFLVVAIMQTIPAITITGGLPTNFLPLGVVLLFDGVVTAREDYTRHVDDNKANTSKVLTMSHGGPFVEKQWKDIRVGDIVKILRNRPVPADCVFLSSFSSDVNTPDSCYVQTAQLDGETNLKLRQAIPATVARFHSDADCATFRGFVRCEPPSSSFDKFVGTLTIAPPRLGLTGAAMPAGGASTEEERAQPLEAAQTLLRGSVIRNVDHVYALVVYTGRETKVRVRQTTTVRKRAQVEKQMNGFIALLVCVLVAFCLTGCIASSLWQAENWQQTPYLFLSNTTATDGVNIFFTFFLLNSSFIPVSLYVTVRLARTFQMLFMERDTEMYFEDPEVVQSSGGLDGSYPFRVRSMDLNDELGQITHVFSDKTGTLTLNYMEFRKMLIAGVSYGLGTTMIGIDRLRREGADAAFVSRLVAEETSRQTGMGIPHVNFVDGSDSHPGRSMAGDLADLSRSSPGYAVHHMLVHLAVNHSVLIETVRDSLGLVAGTRLSASSPDEEAFLCASSSFGYKFMRRTHETITIRIGRPTAQLPFERRSVAAPASAPSAGGPVDGGTATEVVFRILHMLAYSQERKRMSVIVEHPVFDATGRLVFSGGPLFLYCKGADSAILARTLAPSTAAEGQRNSFSKQQLQVWGNDGLRTLAFGYRELVRSDYETWNVEYHAACSDISEMKKMKDKQPNLIDELMDRIEGSLLLQGATANEDKLQPGVPETIAQLAQAGVRVWMLTGDKQETAVNIGFATKLLDDTMRQIVVTVDSAGSVPAAIKRLRIAAKRMAAERAQDARVAATNRSVFQAALVGFDSCLTSVEKAFGFDGPAHSESPLTLDAAKAKEQKLAEEASASKRAARSPASPDRASFAPRGRPSAVSSREGLVQAASNLGRLRSESFQSDDGEDAADDAEHAPRGPQDKAQSALSLLTAAASPAVSGPPVSPRSQPPVDLAVLLAPELGVQRRPFALVIDEQALDYALKHPSARAYLLYAAVNSSAVICCRARPDQKARVVELVRRGVPSSRTLAIGDGANDVNMIRVAHVGVGISGAEGVQAANAADYSFGRFKFLLRLLLVHGRWNYHRMVRLVMYSFAKNLLFVSCQFWYSHLTGWSGQKYYTEYGSQTYNLVYTSLPVLILGIYDQDLDALTALRYPSLFDFTRNGQSMGIRVFVSVVCGALLESVIVFFVCLYGYYLPTTYPSIPYVFQQGTVAFTAVIAVVSLRIAAEMHSHYWFFSGIVLLSCVIWVPACYIFDGLNADGLNGGMRSIYGSLELYLIVILCLGIAGVRILAWKGYKRLFTPELRHVVQEALRFGLPQDSIHKYSDAANLARRTGKTIPEIFDAMERFEQQSSKNPISRSSQRLAVSVPSVTAAVHSSGSAVDDAANVRARMGRLPPPVTPYDPAADFDHTGSTPSATPVSRVENGGGGLELASMSQKRLPGTVPSPTVHTLTDPSPSHGFIQLPLATAQSGMGFADGIHRFPDVPAGPPRPSVRGSGMSSDPAAGAYVSARFTSQGAPTATGPYVPPQAPPVVTRTGI